MDNKKIAHLIEIRQTLHPDDPRLQEIWNELTDLLSRSVDETIDYLENCSADKIYWLSEIFEDIVPRLNSSRFIDCIVNLQRKHTSIDIRNDIDFAKETME